MRLAVPYSSRVAEFACHSPSCAPPPTGSGGSTGGAACHGASCYCKGCDNRRLDAQNQRNATAKEGPAYSHRFKPARKDI